MDNEEKFSEAREINNCQKDFLCVRKPIHTDLEALDFQEALRNYEAMKHHRNSFALSKIKQASEDFGEHKTTHKTDRKQY
ncbi:CLUMA_CG000516, isoform A [Clunio marinus]|uniref:CLUMA_CG000516, isoform A n=1 Tax=Clunio marinus TaxID=568069 RepID=A0A1J1HFQ4_9DIPT|nr:CLUMA_CG000516, isoform A [Clunio marinus]